MISHIYGEITQQGEGFVVLDVNGIGYQVYVTRPVLLELTNKKEKIKLHTYLNVREDALTLYGFTTPSELEMFKLLISVTRIGPQIALNVLSQIKIEELAGAIIHEDEKILTSISGIGAKNARRLILELKDKIQKKMENYRGSAGNVNYDAVSALVSLGFGQREAEEAVEAASVGLKEPDVQILIKTALVKLKER